MTNEPMPTWEQASRAAAAHLAEVLNRLEEPYPDMGEDEEMARARVRACLDEACGILGAELTQQVPDGLLGLGINHARRVLQGAGLAARLARRGGMPLLRPLGPGTWIVTATQPAAGGYLARGESVLLVVAERGTVSPRLRL